MEPYYYTNWISVHDRSYFFEPKDGERAPVWVKDKGMLMGYRENGKWVARDNNGKDEGKVLFYLPVSPPTNFLEMIKAISKMELDEPLTLSSRHGWPHTLIEHEFEKRIAKLNGYDRSTLSTGTELTLIIHSTRDKFEQHLRRKL